MTSSIPQSFINDLLAHGHIVDIISNYLPLRQKGKNYVACCPFHDEKTPSFTINSEKQFFYCFGCGMGGNVINFIMNYERLDFVPALETLAKQLNIEIPREKYTTPTLSEGNSLYAVMEDALNFYHKQLIRSSFVLDYLKQRGISKETMQQFKLGFAPNNWSNLLQALTHLKKYSPNTLQAAGLIIQKQANQYYDRFRYRLMFPIRDRYGRCIGFGGRALSEKQEVKYLNSPETAIFHKSKALYGLYEAYQVCKSFKQLWIVEGYMDVLSLHQINLAQVVATLGTSTSRTHLQQMFRLTEEIIFCFDGDEAGQKAAFRALELSLKILQDGWVIRFLLLPSGEDPDSWARKHGQGSFASLLPQAFALDDFLFKYFEKMGNVSTSEGKTKLLQKALPLLKKIPANIMREQLFARLGRLVNLDPIRLQHLSIQGNQQKSGKLQKLKTYSVQDRAISLLLQYPEQLAPFIKTKLNIIKKEDYPLLTKLMELIKQITPINTAILLEHFREQNTQYAYLISLAQYDWLIPEAGLLKEFQDILIYLKKSLQKNQIENLLQKARKTTLSIEEKKQLFTLLHQ